MNMLERYPDGPVKNKVITLFGNAIKDARLKRELTLQEAALSIGTTHINLWYIENCSQCISNELVESICNFYGLDKTMMAELNFLNNKVYKRHKAYLESIKK